jgi:hypothetical protein
MQFSRTDKCFRVIRVTGPAHNLLGIEFGENSGSTDRVVVESLPTENGGTACLSETEVRENVMLGVADANNELGTGFVVRRIQFIPTDSPPAETYRFLARNIINRLAKGLPFTEVS